MSIDALTAGDVVIRVQYSSINYKDALAATGAGKILRKYPLNGGIDLAGEVVSSTDARYKPGDRCWSRAAAIPRRSTAATPNTRASKGDSVIPLPDGIELIRCDGARHGGLHGGLAIHRMEQNGQKPSMGPIVVTGASAASARSRSTCSRSSATKSSR